MIQMLRRHSGVSVADIITKTGWQPHSVRGFFSGLVRKKLKLPLVSDVGRDGVRRYHIVPSRRRRLEPWRGPWPLARAQGGAGVPPRN